METAVLDAPALVKEFEEHALVNLQNEVDAWSEACRNLARWQKEHLCVETPDRAKLEANKRAVEGLIFAGQIFTLATSRPGFPHRELTQQVEANVWILQEMFLMYHHPNPPGKEEVDRVLELAFPDDP